MKRYIIQFNSDNESSYTPRTLYVPCGEPVQILFKLKDFTSTQTVSSVNLRDASGTTTKECDTSDVKFYIPQSEGSYYVSSFTFKDGITYDTEISGVISTIDALDDIPFTNVIVKPVEPDSISYVDVNAGDIECGSVTVGSSSDANVGITQNNISLSKGTSGAANIYIDSMTGDVTVTDGNADAYTAAMSYYGLSCYSPVSGSTTSVDANGITIGSYTLDEASLQALLALIQNQS